MKSELGRKTAAKLRVGFGVASWTVPFSTSMKAAPPRRKKEPASTAMARVC